MTRIAILSDIHGNLPALELNLPPQAEKQGWERAGAAFPWEKYES
jgi:hypothetical protein